MTPPMSSGIQVPCLLYIDPPYLFSPTHQHFSPYQLNPPYQPDPLHERNPLHKYNSPPSTIIKLPPNIIPPPLQSSTLPPSNVTNPLPPSIVSSTPPLLIDPLPLPTMLITTPSIQLPPSFPTLPLTLSLPHITRHRMSENIGLEAHHFPPLFECAQSICRQRPSGATVACLSRVCCDVIVHAACGQLVPEYLCRTHRKQILSETKHF